MNHNFNFPITLDNLGRVVIPDIQAQELQQLLIQLKTDYYVQLFDYYDLLESSYILNCELI